MKLNVRSKNITNLSCMALFLFLGIYQPHALSMQPDLPWWKVDPKPLAIILGLGTCGALLCKNIIEQDFKEQRIAESVRLNKLLNETEDAITETSNKIAQISGSLSSLNPKISQMNRVKQKHELLANLKEWYPAGGDDES